MISMILSFANKVQLKYQSNGDFEIGDGFSKTFVVSVPEHVTSIEIVDPLAFYFLAFSINVFVPRVSSLEIECLSQFRAGQIVFFE